jgi:hypothetical protein
VGMASMLRVDGQKIFLPCGYFGARFLTSAVVVVLVCRIGGF